MAARREIREFDLVEYALCLMRSPERVPYVRPADVVAAELAAKYALLEAFAGNVPSASRMREFYEEAWAQAVGQDPDLSHVPPRGGLQAARRLRDVLLKYDVWQPVTSYSLNLGRAAIAGEYGVFSLPSRRKEGLFIVRWRHRYERLADKSYLRVADVLTYARWLHLRNLEPQELDLHVLHLSLDSDEMWRETLLLEKRVRASLSTLVERVVTDESFPSPGPYCSNCHTCACRAVAPDLLRAEPRGDLLWIK